MRQSRFVFLTLAATSAVAIAEACSSKPPFVGPDGAAPDDANVTSDIGFPQGNDASSGLIVTPANVTLSVSGAPVTQQYTATDTVSQKVVTGAGWSIDDAPLGSIDANGLFTAAGNYGGVTAVNAELGSAKGTTTLTINATVTENPGGLSSSDQGLLKGGGSADASFRWLYPYDKTVFPRGLGSPILQFDGAAIDKAYVHIQSAHFSYDGFFGGSNPSQITFSSTTWDEISGSAGAGDPVTVQVTKMSGGQVTGPITETWKIAQGSLHGTVYYSSYTSALANGGATLKIKVGTPAQVLVGGCNTCHSVSDNGGVLAASYGHSYDATYDLTKDAGTMTQVPDCTFCLPGVYPDGTFLLSTYGANIPGMGGTDPVALYDTKKGTVVSSTGISSITASMPAFSPDGTKVVFNHESLGGHTLATMNFDVKSKAFTSLTDIVTDTSLYPSWPAFTPDSASVIYHDDDAQDYATWSGNKADLILADVATKKTASLLALNGMTTKTATYLPYGTAETLLNYEPTVLPVAVGGYFWVVFTSRRYYGNIMTPSNEPDPWSSTPRKKLWVAAVDINGTPGTDSSHPAFYLPGQEFNAGNMRGFWALDPCKGDGKTCETADECCGGYCRSTSSGKVCVPPPGGCAQEFEKCTTGSDCCGSTALCVNGHCATPPPN